MYLGCIVVVLFAIVGQLFVLFAVGHSVLIPYIYLFVLVVFVVFYWIKKMANTF